MAYTIKDIAERAGVSNMTVSRVINNSGYVALKTRVKVESALKEMNYMPNLMARSLINQKSTIVSVIVPDISNPFYAELTKGVEEVAIQEGYNIIISSAHRNEEMEVRQIEASRGRMADGVILVLPSLSEAQILAHQENIPLVVVDKYIRSRKISKIYLKQELGSYRAVEYLIHNGHKRIAFLSGSPHIYNNIVREKGYLHALEDNDIIFDKSMILQGDFTFKSGEDAFEKILSMDPSDRPSAVFSASDLMALGFMRSAFRNNYNIPEDISIVGFDDITISSMTNPPLTTVRHPYVKMGMAAMQLLLHKLGSGSSQNGNIELKNRLIIRETVKSKK